MDIKINLDIDKLKNKTLQATSLVRNFVMNYTETEAKVLEATNNDAWGASGTLMTEIAKSTYNYEEFEEVMNTIYKRFAESGPQWRQIYKALTLMEYLIKNGSEKVADNCKDHQYDLKALMTYQHVDDKGKDQGINVRNRAKEIVLLLQSPARIQEERQKAKSNRDKYIGVSSEMSPSEIAAHSASARPNQSYSSQQSRGYDEPKSYNNYEEEEQIPAPRQTRQSHSSSPAPQTSNSPAPKKMPQVKFTSDDAFGPPASSQSGFGDFGDFNSGNTASGFGDFGAPASNNSGFGDFGAPASNNSGFGSFGAPAPSSSNNNNAGFGSFGAPTPSSNNNAGFSNQSASFNAFGGDFDFNAAAANNTRPKQNQQQNLDPFGDMPLTPTSANNNASVLLPDGAKSKSTVPGQAFGGLVDLDNLKRYDQGKKEEKPAAAIGSMQTTTQSKPMSSMGGMGGMNTMGGNPRPMGGSMPMGGNMGGNMGGMGGMNTMGGGMGGNMGGMGGMNTMGGGMGGNMGGNMGGFGGNPNMGMGGNMGGMGGMNTMGGGMGGNMGYGARPQGNMGGFGGNPNMGMGGNNMYGNQGFGQFK